VRFPLVVSLSTPLVVSPSTPLVVSLSNHVPLSFDRLRMSGVREV